MCNECLEKLLVPLHLISTCVYTKNNIKNGVNLDPEEFDSINNVNAVVETGDQWKCFFCTKITERDDLVSLNDSNENMFLLDILKKHFPELNLSNSEVHLTCETCLDSLRGLLSFMRNRLNVEEKIRTYTEIEETDSKGQVELCNAQEFTLKPILKFESEYCDINDKSECYNEIREKFTIKEETEIKTEEIINQEIHINHEENDIKLDQSNCETASRKVIFNEWKINTRRKSREIMQNLGRTGGGEPINKKLSDIEERLLNLISKIHVGDDVIPDSLGEKFLEMPASDVSGSIISSVVIDEITVANESEDNSTMDLGGVPSENVENVPSAINNRKFEGLKVQVNASPVRTTFKPATPRNSSYTSHILQSACTAFADSQLTASENEKLKAEAVNNLANSVNHLAKSYKQTELAKLKLEYFKVFGSVEGFEELF
ncbi:hypothetical protein NQ314_000392 [Rhamnusium bicolor]|uniref:ZAD domain-containing protein n=1 Tax=Rhamnusium bicolor TaxID=1586634 RepID=A0AAV8ZXD0_9CUCU|nr:hypothetical protein NQ314_000392 [Rhamnusium bicolor]